MAEALITPGVQLGFLLFGVGEDWSTLLGVFVGEVLIWAGIFLGMRLVWERFAAGKGKAG